jgi:hypothetical protein
MYCSKNMRIVPEKYKNIYNRAYLRTIPVGNCGRNRIVVWLLKKPGSLGGRSVSGMLSANVIIQHPSEKR